MDTDETSTASMDNHMVTWLQFVGKSINDAKYFEKYSILSMSIIVTHKNCVECQQDLVHVIIEIMDTDETSNAYMDNHMVMWLQFVGKWINDGRYFEKYAILAMSCSMRHKNCVECQQDLGTHDNRNNGHWRNK